MKKILIAVVAAFALTACSHASTPAPTATSTASSPVVSSAPVSTPVASSPPASSQTVSAPSTTAVTSTPVVKPNISYKINGNLLVITVKGKIAPLYVKVQNWSKVNPDAGFPQKPLSAQNFVVTGSVTIKLSEHFYQQDIYASSKNDIKVPAVLNAKTDDQPDFLSTYANGPSAFRTN